MKRVKSRAAWDDTVRAAFGSCYRAWPHALAYYIDLWTAHLDAGLADGEQVAALTGDDDFARRQRMWEMQLAAHLRACGHVLDRRPEGEPDYKIKTGGAVIWVEAVSPGPGEHPPQSWLDDFARSKAMPVNFDVRVEGDLAWIVGAQVDEPPFEWALSRWTSALREKQAKGADYEKRGVTRPGEAYVIAIDGGQLSRLTMATGASGLPLGLEATFPIGPRAFRFGEGGRLHGMENLPRFEIKNHNGASIPTERFLDGEFSNVSAVLGCWPPMFKGPELPVHVIHNPLARVRVALGTFGKDAEEWHAIKGEDGDSSFWQVVRFV